MFRMRCRPKYSDDELRSIYASTHEHHKYPDHRLRVAKTCELLGRFVDVSDRSAADLSAGDGYILNHLSVPTKIYGDWTPGYEYTGAIEDTILAIPPVDVFLCCETLEHLDDPDLVLRRIRMKAKKLVISTPICRWWDENPEHYWSWDTKAVKKMLIDANWTPKDYEETYYEPGYCFQIWGCV